MRSPESAKEATISSSSRRRVRAARVAWAICRREARSRLITRDRDRERDWIGIGIGIGTNEGVSNAMVERSTIQ